MHRLSILAAALAVGCSQPKPTVRSVPPAPTSASTTASKAAEPRPVAVSPQLAVSDELAQRCALRFASAAEAPSFDYDRFELGADDRDMLEQVATCLTTGPLRGKAVQLIGRADPRGTEEYNLALGVRRADAVQQYLERLGVAPAQLAKTTRGALDAAGTDEAGWRLDRRVDLRLPPG